MPIDPEEFRVKPGEAVDVRNRPTEVAALYADKKDARSQIKDRVKKLAALQERLYAENSQSLLVILQAMDTGGKDSLIRNVFSGINPQGCQVHTFGRPSQMELDHDFLWRSSLVLPQRGTIGVFNRSYYEEVLVVKVHEAVLHAQNLPPAIRDSDSIWPQRYQSILDHERHLQMNGTRIVKLMLHISPEEQRKRLLDRIEDPEKQWKYKYGDIEEREHWERYMQVYSDCVSATSTQDAPWYVVPGDDKYNARLIVSEVLLAALQGMDPHFPPLSEEAKADLKRGREALHGKSKR